MKYLRVPIQQEDIDQLQVGDMVSISGDIYAGRDAVLPKLIRRITEDGDEALRQRIQGGVIFHTAVSVAGVGPTSSNKLEIESSIVPLSELGVKIHLGKGAIGPSTIEGLEKNNAVFAVIPPVTALLNSKIREQEVVAFPEEGMEALHRLAMENVTVIIAAAHGKSIY